MTPPLHEQIKTQPITARELRIGSTVQHTNNSGTYTGKVIECLRNGVNVCVDGQIGEWFFRHEELQGVVISPKLFKWFGFELVSGCYWTLNGLSFCHEDNDPGYWEASTGVGIYPVDCPSIQFVHELQNMFYVMRGQELTPNK